MSFLENFFRKLAENCIYWLAVSIPVYFLWHYLIKIGISLPEIGYVGCLAIVILVQMIVRAPPPVVHFHVASKEDIEEIIEKQKEEKDESK